MNAKSARMAPMPAHTSLVTVLKCHTSNDVDHAVLRAIDHQYGSDGAAEVICTALEWIALQIGQLPELLAGSNLMQLTKTAVDLTHQAGLIGLCELVRAADHLAICATDNDGIALAAIVARLERGFEAAVPQIWDYWEN